jgi:hypothetical protein
MMNSHSGKSWRDLVKVHPAAELFPMMSSNELLALSEDIGENGLHDPIIMWSPFNRDDVPAKVRRGQAWPTEFYLLDGRNRLAAIDLLPEEKKVSWGLDSFLDAPDQDFRDPRTKLYFERYCDPWSYVVSANVHRRHLTTVQRREIVAALLKAKPERSDNATARLAHVSDKTVTSVRRELEATSEIPKLDATVGADGRSRARPSRPPEAPADDAREEITACRPVMLLAPEIPEHLRPVVEMLGQITDKSDRLFIKLLVRDWS